MTHNELKQQLHLAILNKKNAYEAKSPSSFNFWNTQVELLKEKINEYQFFT